MRDEQWHKVIDVSLNGFFRVTQPLLLPMLRTRWGRILNMTSIMSHVSLPGRAAYSGSKFGLLGMTKALALELAPALTPVDLESEISNFKSQVKGSDLDGEFPHSGPQLPQLRRTP